MRKKIQFIYLFLFIVIATKSFGAGIAQYHYETVPNDPLKARIYTLPNGLKVYMTVNKETPRIQTYIAVRVGGKNDPAETTGLAHYFEHLMFKGTKKFGTQNYETEKPLLDLIEQEFEIYRKTSDESQRKAIYKTIDSLSYEASKISIPNEYDKLMATIGANGTNAYTSFDQTVFVENIPSNQIENWAKIQADRFQNAVIRGFHTELETVYEEKNMSLTKDPRKVYENILSALFPHHPYGTQTVLGTQENLKNPSITNIKHYYTTWYVPNNIAICLSGNFNPDEMIATIDKYFGGMKPNPNLPKLNINAEPAITAPIVREVLGPDAESITLGWRFPGIASKEFETLQIISQIMNNGKAGLIDLDLNQQQKVLNAGAGTYDMADYCAFIMQARPKQGQTLDDAKALLLQEVTKLKAGNFDDKMLEANINNFKYELLQRLESNEGRADMFVNSFISGTKWADEVTSIERMSKITKQQIVDFANKYFAENYAVIYKKQGKDPNEKKISKPQITPIYMNRDVTSPFLKEIQTSAVKPIEPVFIDFKKDLKQFKAKSAVPVLYKQNVNNDLFELIYLFDMGSNNDKALGLAFQYMEYLGTSKLTPKQLKSEFYRLACSFDVFTNDDRTYVVLRGLNENLSKAVSLFEKLLNDAQVNKGAYANLANDLIKARANAKLNQAQNFSRLTQYAIWGPKSPTTNILSADELKNMDPKGLIKRIHELDSFKHRIIYYGPYNEQQLLTVLNKYHNTPVQLKNAPKAVKFEQQITQTNKIFIAPYEAKQIYMSQVSNNGEKYNLSIEPTLTLYNEYFGGGMNSIVFQEMRESRGLAYSARATLISPSKLDRNYMMRTMIATQNDKMIESINVFNQIINDMPHSEAAFKLAKEALIARLRTERVTKADIIWAYINAQDLGLSIDTRKKVYDEVQKMSLQDVSDFQKKWVKGRNYTYCILGDEKELDMDKLAKFGPIQRLTQKDIFGY